MRVEIALREGCRVGRGMGRLDSGLRRNDGKGGKMGPRLREDTGGGSGRFANRPYGEEEGGGAGGVAGGAAFEYNGL